MKTRNRARKGATGNRIAAKGAASALVVASLAGGGVIAASSPSQALGFGDVINGATTAYQQYAHCKTNLDNGESCLTTDQDLLYEIRKQNAALLKKVEAHHAEVMGEFGTVENYLQDIYSQTGSIEDGQKLQAFRDEKSALMSDFDTTKTGMAIYTSFVDCLSANAAAAPGSTGTCSVVDQFGTAPKSRPATGETIDAIAGMLVANETEDSARGIRGWTMTPTEFEQRIGGNTTNPNQGEGLLARQYEVIHDKEMRSQGLDPTRDKLTLMDSEYVNSIDDATRSVLDVEQSYFATRIATAGIRGDDSTAEGLTNLAENGRPSDGLMSIEDQFQTYTAARSSLYDSRSARLASNQAYLVDPAESGPIYKITLSSEGSHGPVSSKVPSPDQLATFARLVSSLGGKSLQGAHSDVLPYGAVFTSDRADDQYVSYTVDYRTSDGSTSGITGSGLRDDPETGRLAETLSLDEFTSAFGVVR